MHAELTPRNVEPFAYLSDVLQRIVSGRCKMSELTSLLPWNWRPKNKQASAPDG